MDITKDNLMERMYGNVSDVAQEDVVKELDLDLIDDLFSFEHPFDKSYKRSDGIEELTEQIRLSGVLVPITVRKAVGGRYECLAGHRRRKAAKEAGLKSIPAIIKDCTDEEAMVIVAERQVLLPSEKAKAYALKVEGLKRQGKRTDLLLEGDEEERLTARDQAAMAYNVSPRDISRYIRLTQLSRELLDVIDDSEDKRLTATAGFILADLDEEAQKKLYRLIEGYGLKVSVKKAQRIMEEELLSQDIPDDQVMDILSPATEDDKISKIFRKAMKTAERKVKGYISKGELDEEDLDEEELFCVIENAIRDYLSS